MTPLDIMQHALGLDEYGQGRAYRNHYVAARGSDDFSTCDALVADDLMVRHEPRAIFGGADSYCFTVTDAGREYVRQRSPKPPRLTRGQKRYRDYLSADSPLTFGEWLRLGGYRAGP